MIGTTRRGDEVQPGGGVLQAGRAAALTGGSLAVATVGHASAGGTIHVSGGLAVAAVALFSLCYVLAERQRGVLTIATVSVLAQPVIHMAASVGGHSVSTNPSNPSVMALAHVVAALAAAVLLAEGERLLWRTTQQVRLWVSTLSRENYPLTSAGCPPLEAAPVPNAELVTDCHPRRGPPLPAR
jgi:hypothetical protein